MAQHLQANVRFEEIGVSAQPSHFTNRDWLASLEDMHSRILPFLLLAICLQQFISLPGAGVASSVLSSDTPLFVEESGESESVEELCHWIGHLVSLDCQHDQIVGEVHLLFHIPETPRFESCVYLRGPPNLA